MYQAINTPEARENLKKENEVTRRRKVEETLKKENLNRLAALQRNE